MTETNKLLTPVSAGKKILIVEDEIPISSILGDRFTKEGFQVWLAHNGREGLTLAQQHLPDLVLLDIVMPEMDGMTMLRQMRAQDWGRKIKVVVLTNLADADRADEAAREGVYDFLIKSNWQLKDLITLAHKKLSN